MSEGTGAGTPVEEAAPSARTVSGLRVGVGLLLGVIVVLVLLLDGLLGTKGVLSGAAPGTGLLLALLAAAAAKECFALLDAAGLPSPSGYGAWVTFTLLALRAWLPAAGVRQGDAAALALAGLLLAVLLPGAARIAFRRPGEAGEGDGMARADLRPLGGLALGLLLVSFPLALLLELRLVPPVEGMRAGIPSGLVLASMVVVACKVGDSAAYFTGRTFGRRPLCRVSPKKTWEGAVAGALAGTAAAAAVGRAFGLPLHHGLAFGLVVNLAGQGGDLLESWLKRCCGAKDSGRTFGEMGGALDLVDALLLAGPAGWLFHRVVLA